MVYFIGILTVMFSACIPIDRDKNQIVARDEITAIEIGEMMNHAKVKLN